MLRLNNYGMASCANHPNDVPGLLDPGASDGDKNVALLGCILTLHQGKLRLAANPGRTLATIKPHRPSTTYPSPSGISVPDPFADDDG